MTYDASPISLPYLPTNKTIFSNLDSHRGFRFRKNLKTRAPNGRYREFIKDECAIALALTEICCKHGQGMVSFFPRPEKPPFTDHKQTEEMKNAVRIYYRLPELIYTARSWNGERKVEWQSMNHEDRMIMLNARCGGIMKETPIMAINLTYTAEKPDQVQVNAFHSDEAGCNARMVITPQMHLGWNRELVEATQIRFARGTWTDGRPVTYRIEDDRLATCHITSAEDLSRRLWDMFRSGEPRSIGRFGELTEALGELHSLRERM